MAEFLYTFAVEEILKKLGLVAVDWISRGWELGGDLERLRGSTNWIQKRLQDAVDRQSTDERIRHWLVKLQDVVYEADDVLDEFAYWTLKKQVRGKGILTLEYLSLLQTLNIDTCLKITTLQGLNFCTSLQQLTIVDCDGLVSMAAESEEFHGLTCLRELRVIDCKNLASIPSVQYLTSLKELTIDDCPKLTVLPAGLKYCTSLQQLRIYNWKKLISIPELPSSLVDLRIQLCESLSYIPNDMLCNLTHLKELKIGCFSRELEEYPALNSIQNLNLAALEELWIYGWSNELESLPHQLQHLTSLKGLHIWYFNGLEDLPQWFFNLSSLQRLGIYGCENLMYLSTSMQRLSNLKTLEIGKCPLLKERCAEGRG